MDNLDVVAELEVGIPVHIVGEHSRVAGEALVMLLEVAAIAESLSVAWVVVGIVLGEALPIPCSVRAGDKNGDAVQNQSRGSLY